eukprot:ANDGO_08534.mRNA.1 hypothetical protein
MQRTMSVTPATLRNTHDNLHRHLPALDPGVRTFATGYAPSGRMSEVGAKDASCIYRLCLSADKLSSKIAKVFCCPSCKCTVDRDWNGARSIYIYLRNVSHAEGRVRGLAPFSIMLCMLLGCSIDYG